MGSTIFLSYARQDIDQVRNVYKTLKDAGLEPWMDSPPPPYELDGLTPGIPWEDVVRQRLSEARVTLAFMSNVSVTKQGYVQKEFRLALSQCAMQAPGTASLIPVLLDDCTPPNYRVDTVSLHDLQWYPLHKQGLDMLVAHLRAITAPVPRAPNHSPEYLDLLMQVNDLRIDREWTIKQMDKLRDEKAATEAQYSNLMAKYAARLSDRYDDDKFRERF